MEYSCFMAGLCWRADFALSSLSFWPASSQMLYKPILREVWRRNSRVHHRSPLQAPSRASLQGASPSGSWPCSDAWVVRWPSAPASLRSRCFSWTSFWESSTVSAHSFLSRHQVRTTNRPSTHKIIQGLFAISRKNWEENDGKFLVWAGTYKKFVNLYCYKCAV